LPKDSGTVSDVNAREVAPGMAEQIARRMHEVGIDGIGQLATRARVTTDGLKPLLRGERRNYQRRLTGPVCRALGWPHDAIDRLMRGEPPGDEAVTAAQSSAGTPSATSTPGMVPLDTARLIEVLPELAQALSAQLDAATALVAALLQLQPAPPPTPLPGRRPPDHRRP
jgi:hypothetical protein